jgi:hypothetical protein
VLKRALLVQGLTATALLAIAPARAVVAASPTQVGSCPAQPPVMESDWKPMLKALKRFVARDTAGQPSYLAVGSHELVRRFEPCRVQVSEESGGVLVTARLGGKEGAHFRRTARGWKVTALDGGDN